MNCHGNGKNTGRNHGTKDVDRGKAGRMRRSGWIAGLLIVGLFLAIGISKGAGSGWFGDVFKKSPAETAKSAGVIETAGEVKIPLPSLDSGRAIFLKSVVGGKEIHFFAMKSSDGVYRAAFDACDVCFRSTRGYRQEGDLMVCNNCGQTFPSVQVNEVRGGCNPAPLSRTVSGEYLVIRKADLAAGANFFVRKRS
jgi:uncharacterized membrane protein